MLSKPAHISCLSASVSSSHPSTLLGWSSCSPGAGVQVLPGCHFRLVAMGENVLAKRVRHTVQHLQLSVTAKLNTEGFFVFFLFFFLLM